MKKILVLLLILTATNLYSQNSSLNEILTKYEDSLISKKYGVIALIKNNDKIHKSAIGWAYKSERMTPNKVFNIGSLTKMFTSVLILQEVENHKLKLSDTIGKFFPDNKNVDSKITIEQLLRHRSGLGEIAVDTIVNKAFSNYFNSYNNSNLYKKIPLPQFKRGEEYKYTDTNYILLGYILELINDKPYSDLLKTKIFKPCNMENSYPYFSKYLKNSAHPIFNGRDLNQYVNFRYFRNYAFSAGGISSTVDDLEKFFVKLYETNDLLSENLFKKMTDFKDNYGLGIELINAQSEKGPYKLIGHGGDNISFTIRDYYNQETGDLVIVVANQYGAKEVHEIANELLEKVE